MASDIKQPIGLVSFWNQMVIPIFIITGHFHMVVQRSNKFLNKCKNQLLNHFLNEKLQYVRLSEITNSFPISCLILPSFHQCANTNYDETLTAISNREWMICSVYLHMEVRTQTLRITSSALNHFSYHTHNPRFHAKHNRRQTQEPPITHK